MVLLLLIVASFNNKRHGPCLVNMKTLLPFFQNKLTFTHLLGKDEEMQLHKLLPSVVTFNSCIMALAFGGRWMEALHLFGTTNVGIQLPTLVLRYHALLLATERLDVWTTNGLGTLVDPSFGAPSLLSKLSKTTQAVPFWQEKELYLICKA